MVSIGRWIGSLLTISPNHWEYLKGEVPKLSEMERFLRDHDRKRRIMVQLENTPLHSRANLFMELTKAVRDESYQLQLQERELHGACKTAHAVAEAGRYHKLHLLMSGMDCETFWRDWMKNIEAQEEFFERAGENVWLESARMDQLHNLLDEEHKILHPLTNVRKSLRYSKRNTETQTIESAVRPQERNTGALSAMAMNKQLPKNIDEKWTRFRDVNAQNTCRCPGSLNVQATPEEAPLFRQLAQEIREKRLPEENIRMRFIELLQRVENAQSE